jgi:hypothetical protein
MLKRMLVTVVFVVGSLVVPATASANHSLVDFDAAVAALAAADPTIASPPNDSGKDFVVGGGQSPQLPGGINFGISAHSGPLGEDPFGHTSATFNQPEPMQFRGRATCLAVAGNNAAIGFVPTDTASNDLPVDLVLAVRDSGLPGGFGDMATAYFTSAQNCPALVGAALHPLTRGNLLVHDATP